MDNLKLASSSAFTSKTFAAVMACILLLCLSRAEAQKKAAAPERVPTGMSITPTVAPGSSLQFLNPDLPGMPEYLADHPIATALSPDGITLLVLTSGYNRVSDIKGKSIPALSNEYVFIYGVTHNPPVKRQALQIPNTYMGIAWASDGKTFYVSGGTDDNVHIFSQDQNEARWSELLPAISLGHRHGLGASDEEDEGSNKSVAAGLAVSKDGTRLLVANNANDSVSLVDLAQKKVIAELDLRPRKSDPAQINVPGGEYPYDVAFKGNNKAYVSSLRDREIVVIDLRGAPAIAARIKTRGQPGKMILNPAQTVLFAVADNSDSVVIVDTAKDRILSEIKTVAPTGMLSTRSNFKGANPTGLAFSPDNKTLYVTNGGTNSVAVIQLDREMDEGRVVGLIPTAWYPNAASVSRNGKFLYVVNAKSIPGPNPGNCRKDFATKGDRPCALAQQYVWQLEKGGLTTIPLPGPVELKALTLQVSRNNHFAISAKQPESNALFAFLRTKIHHVIYIIKENRTYDQVLGDLEKGNGDPRLALFPEPLAPNHHAIARQFVTLDNFYDSGEVSGVGWNWSTAARATDFVERTIPMNYADRGIGYDVEGMNRGINIGAPRGEERTHDEAEGLDDQLPGPADVAAPDGPGEDETGAGYLWDSALRAKLTVRNYGFFANLAHYSATPNGGPAVPLLHDPAATGVRVAFPTNARLQDITDPYFRSFDMRFADYWRFKEWEREFDGYVKNNNLPNLELLRLPHDHFGNFSEAQDGVNTVETMMADNDYAVGLVLEKVAHSKYAADTLIFAIEDDAQNGADHVDAHRSIALIAGPYVKQGAVVSRYYTTVSLLRTIEEILGMKPLGLYDAFESPMTEVFSTKQRSWTYTAVVPKILYSTQLPLPAPGQQQKSGNLASWSAPRHDAAYWSEQTKDFDFSVEDKLDSDRFNQILWNGLKGEEAPYPSERDGRDLRENRPALLREFNKSKD
ncbi:MAG TPA: bifunctional YncE family protein/alkaline phosphatase family protein [Candidatus Angelobacter sp.]|nr:bifunctional YncE family protein/alkaline phosphatase family protein [Candidatus Angelobacter sp.]